MNLRRAYLYLALFSLQSLGCASVKSTFVWVDNLEEPYFTSQTSNISTIGAGDLLNIRVYNQENASTRARVGSDGYVSIPLAGEIKASGLTPGALAKQIELRLKAFIIAPSVTVDITELHPLELAVLGEVNRPARVELPRNATVLDALAAGGGLSEFAARDRIFVLRRNPVLSAAQEDALLRIRFSYEKLSRAVGAGPLFKLQSGDVVVVE